ncbi:hypothetical protein [Roseiarcus sp.]|uniref:hypothetical protein n=1 Tax=Roseiarcus sp. TaxID=1969460 RepID=UPI003F963AFD
MALDLVPTHVSIPKPSAQALAGSAGRSRARRALLAARAQAAAERERTHGHGHGMSRNRTPSKESGLPHDSGREEKQPYSREVEDYSDDGAAHGPREQTDDQRQPRAR